MCPTAMKVALHRVNATILAAGPSALASLLPIRRDLLGRIRAVEPRYGEAHGVG